MLILALLSFNKSTKDSWNYYIYIWFYATQVFLGFVVVGFVSLFGGLAFFSLFNLEKSDFNSGSVLEKTGCMSGAQFVVVCRKMHEECDRFISLYSTISHSMLI